MTQNRLNHQLQFLIFGVLVCMLWSCGSSKQEIQLALIGTNRLNLSENGQPLPVLVRIYTLRNKDRFNRATFEELWKRDHELLGDDLLHSRELTLNPDSQSLLEMTVDQEKDENFLGIMALFRKGQPGGWRMLIPIEEPSTFSFGATEIHLRVGQNSISQVEPD